MLLHSVVAHGDADPGLPGGVRRATGWSVPGEERCRGALPRASVLPCKSRASHSEWCQGFLDNFLLLHRRLHGSKPSEEVISSIKYLQQPQWPYRFQVDQYVESAFFYPMIILSYS